MSAENRAYKDCHVTDELMTRMNNYTPDYLDLKMEKNIPIFIYDSLKTGGQMNAQVSDGTFLGDAHTMTQSYDMRVNCETNEPVAFSSMNGHYLQGEVYIVQAYDILNLDYLFGNNHRYKREIKFIALDDQTMPLKKSSIQRPAIKCWVWIGLEDYWKDILTESRRTVDNDGKRMYNWVPPKHNAIGHPSGTDQSGGIISSWKPALMNQWADDMSMRQEIIPF